MARLTETTKREFSKRLLDILNSNAAALQDAGVDIKPKSDELSGLIDDAFSAEEKQLKAQTEARRATETSQMATSEAYQKASDIVELIIGALGKRDVLSKRLRNLRNEIGREPSRGSRGSEG